MQRVSTIVGGGIERVTWDLDAALAVTGAPAVLRALLARRLAAAGAADTVVVGGAKETGSVLTPVFKDADTGLNSINPITSINKGRVQDLAKDLDTGKLALHEGQAAVQLENTFGSTLKRVDPIQGQKNPDFIFTDGPYAGKTVDFMWTDSTRAEQMNKFFSNNAARNQAQLIDHINKADIVPLDYRNLTQTNQNMVNSWIKALPENQRNKVLILR